MLSVNEMAILVKTGDLEAKKKKTRQALEPVDKAGKSGGTGTDQGSQVRLTHFKKPGGGGIPMPPLVSPKPC